MSLCSPSILHGLCRSQPWFSLLSLAHSHHEFFSRDSGSTWLCLQFHFVSSLFWAIVEDGSSFDALQGKAAPILQGGAVQAETGAVSRIHVADSKPSPRTESMVCGPVGGADHAED